MVEAMGIQVATGEGSNLVSSHQTMQNAMDYVRSGQGPYFLEFSTYRWREHCGHEYDNNLGYRTAEEFAYWKSLDPLDTLESTLNEESTETQAQINSIKSAINQEIKTAFENAKNAPVPDQGTAYQHVYA